MRWLVITAVAVWASFSVCASEPVAESFPVGEPSAPILSQELPPLPEAKPFQKRKAGKHAALKKSILSRTARTQMALMAAPARSSSIVVKSVFDDDESDDGTSDLDLHRSYGRPRVVKPDLDDQDGVAVSDTVRLRLFMARMRAMEAYKLAQAAKNADDVSISDTAKLRLLIARQIALRIHRQKYT